ncbi:hypothetical protein [Rhodococcus sp. 14-2470-1a]|uniref:hypothetical protein n=1 Tax=Rhodococcus sp. 14-2470-1a TaxID=2023150 RepID=UPI00117AFF2A|nr:hypothetical protein [Rhodococcus sp. 14-2470-1a]
MKLPIAVVAVCAVLFVLSGCSGGEDRAADPSPAASATSTITATTTAPSSVVPTTEAPPVPVTTAVEPVETYVEPSPVYEEPYIVECQRGGGLGPIVTSWSDGTETGWSSYCQSVHDQALQSEVDANTPTCESAVCVYPNGATIPNPNYRVVQTPSPWVQGQIDWQNCLEAGNTDEFCRATLN